MTLTGRGIYNFTNLKIIHSISSLSRIFYLLDPVCAKKFEMKTDASPPEFFPLYGLPKKLQPSFKTDEWNQGKYELINETENCDIYIYIFNSTAPASSLNNKTKDIFKKKRSQ